MPAAHLAIAFESVGWTSPHYFTYLVIQALVGNWDRNMGTGADSGSRLAETVAKEGLAHKFHAFNTVYKNTGAFPLIVSNYFSFFRSLRCLRCR